METRAHHILIGLFTVVVAGAALGFALWLGKVGSDRRFDLYDVVFEEAVAGLSKGSTVEFNGIKVGEVSSLRLDPKDPRRVLARIRVDSEAPIRSDTRARLVPTGITGIYTIRLTSGDDPHSQPLRATDGTVPVIVAQPSPLSKLLSNGEDLMSNINELLIQARAILSSENAAAVTRTIRQLDQTTGALAAEREDMVRAVRELASASEQANAALAEATKVMNTTNHLLDSQGAPTLENARSAMAAFEQAMRRVDGLLADNRGQFDRGMRGVAELGPAVAELRQTLASLRAVTRQLEDRPADYLLGREPTKEFQP